MKNISVIGAGIMGKGIAHSIFKHGYEIKLFDINREGLEKAVADIKSKAKRKMDPEKIKMALTLEDTVEDADLIIEAVFEDIDVKCALFKKLGQIAPKDTIFASNTSSLSISKMAAASGRADRFLGLHFFNPPLIMRLVEVVSPEGLKDDVLENVKEFIANIKKTGIKCKESAGFIVNRILIPLVNEAFCLLEEKAKGEKEKIVEFANDVDSAILKEGVLLIGPFDLVDLTGIDTIYKVAEIIYNGFNKSKRYIPPALMKKYVDAGLFGRKTKRGIYCFENETNDPDRNPPLNENGKKIDRAENPVFDTIDLTSIIVNEAFRVVEEGIVDSFEDIETCMELGPRWPKGPFLMAKDIGVKKIFETLKEKYEKSGGNPRYEPCGLFENMPPNLTEFFND